MNFAVSSHPLGEDFISFAVSFYPLLHSCTVFYYPLKEDIMNFAVFSYS